MVLSTRSQITHHSSAFSSISVWSAHFAPHLYLPLSTGDADIVIKTGTDIWLSAKKSKSRVLFALLLHKNMHYISVVEEIKKLSLSLFSKAYFSEA